MDFCRSPGLLKPPTQDEFLLFLIYLGPIHRQSNTYLYTEDHL